VLSHIQPRAGHLLHLKQTVKGARLSLEEQNSQTALWITRSACEQRKARGLGSGWRSSVVHFSTAPFVHRCTTTDQRICLNHPQIYAQGASLATPGAGVIGARSHAGPGILCARRDSLPAIVEYQRAGQALVSFGCVRNRSARTAEDG